MADVSSMLSNGQDQVITNANVLNATGNIVYLECNSLAIAEALIKMLPNVSPSDTATESEPTSTTPIFTAQDPLVTDSPSVPTIVKPDDGGSGLASTSTEGETSINTFPNYGTASLPSEAISQAPASCDVYIEHMFPLKHGYPLWFPEPDSSRSVEYRRKGVSVGDVGVITSDGGFDFLFNIWLEAQDPINPDDLPEDFDSLPRPAQRIIPRAAFGPSPNSKVSSLNVISRLDRNTRNLLLKMRLAGIERDGLLVMGKANDPNSPYYEWKETGEASHSRTGPIPNSDLNAGNGIQAAPENQCLFLRGFKISLSEETWDKMLDPQEVVVTNDNNNKSNCINELLKSSGSTRNTNHCEGFGSGHNAFSNNIGVTSFPVKNTVIHPLNVINEIIFSQVPEADIAITHDNFWIELINHVRI
ncbi:hypothetical protein BDQ17DRAFT_1411343 [Cyathus striatus]|nr:hypothetical protein BDQ17DRAFT_1411343 [Cyathus striatus]